MFVSLVISPSKCIVQNQEVFGKICRKGQEKMEEEKDLHSHCKEYMSIQGFKHGLK